MLTKRRMRRIAVIQPEDQSIRYIPLTQGQVAVVDATDYPVLNTFNWFAHRSRTTYYAETNIFYDGRYKTVSMQVFLTGNEQTDHCNRNGLDNRRCNLRPATNSQNVANGRRRGNNTSGYKGVSFSREFRDWVAYITVNYKRRHLGHFPNPVLAAQAYDDAAKKLFGEFASLNFPTK